MPFSPIVRILFVASALVFPGVLLTIHEIPGQEQYGMSPDGWTHDSIRRFHVVAVHPDGTRAIRVRNHHPWRGTRSGLAVNWSDDTTYFYFQPPHERWSLEEWNHAKILLFSDIPVAIQTTSTVK